MSSPRARFYADENVEQDLILYIRNQGFRVESAQELGLCPRDDAFHLQEAARRKCILLTRDADFLDHRRFPFHKLRNTAVIVIRTEPNCKNRLHYGCALVCLLDEVALSGNANLHGLKIEIRGARMVFHAEIDGEIQRDEVDILKPLPTRSLFEKSIR